MIEFSPQDHVYRNNGVVYPSVTTILACEGFYGDAAQYFTEYSRDRGTFVHRIIQYHIESVLDEETIDPVLQPYYDAWLRFEGDTGFVSSICEQPMASELYQFAGTPDHIGPLSGHESVIDVKSGAMNPAAQIQTAAYEILYGKPLHRYGLQLKPDGKYSLRQFKERQDRGIFLAALSIYQWKKNNKIRRD